MLPKGNKKADQKTGLRNHGADNGARTRDPNLGKVVLYQLSHVRVRVITIRESRAECKQKFEKI